MREVHRHKIWYLKIYLVANLLIKTIYIHGDQTIQGKGNEDTVLH